jgi:hypothetical protein
MTHQTKTRSRLQHRPARIVGLIVAPPLLFAGCAAQPEPAAPPLPRLAEVRGDAEERAREIIPESPDAPWAMASFQAIDLPLDQPTDDAWALVNEDAFPALTRGVWNANGLRIGVLPRQNLDAFIRALPPASGIERQQLWGSERPTPIRRAPRIRGPVGIDLTIPPASVREEEVVGGRLQLLARLSRGDGSTMALDLVPHHHVPRLTLEVREAAEKELDGRIFNELALRSQLPSHMVLVVGLYRPWPQAEPMSEAEGAAGESPAVEPPPLPNQLGRAFFASARLGRLVQTILIATIEPITPR